MNRVAPPLRGWAVISCISPHAEQAVTKLAECSHFLRFEAAGAKSLSVNSIELGSRG